MTFLREVPKTHRLFPSFSATKTGTWEMSGNKLILAPFWTLPMDGAPKLLKFDQVEWKLTTTESSFSILGGDSLDKNYWQPLSRAKPEHADE